eukprot:763149-Hanusia_phi.AAC.1
MNTSRTWLSEVHGSDHPSGLGGSDPKYSCSMLTSPSKKGPSKTGARKNAHGTCENGKLTKPNK